MKKIWSTNSYMKEPFNDKSVVSRFGLDAGVPVRKNFFMNGSTLEIPMQLKLKDKQNYVNYDQ